MPSAPPQFEELGWTAPDSSVQRGVLHLAAPHDGRKISQLADRAEEPARQHSAYFWHTFGAQVLSLLVGRLILRKGRRRRKLGI